MVETKLKRGLVSETTTTAENEVAKRQKIQLSSDSVEILKLLDSVFTSSAAGDSRILLRKLDSEVSKDPTLAPHIIDSLSSRLKSLPPNYAAEVWLLIRKCFKLSEIAGDVKSTFLEQATANVHCEDAWIMSKFKIMSIAFVGENIEVDASRAPILEMLDDHDQRIRLASLNALYLIFKRGGDLALPQYSKAINMLADISHQVRLAAYRILFAFAFQTPDKMIPARNIKNNEEIRLIDDAFAHLCDSMNDPESSVRAEGATLLGKFDGVSMRFLHQTLEKNLMTNLNRIRSLNERAKGEGGEFSSGRKFGDDKAIRGEVEDDNNVIARGACGAFIHGLEDEFQTVRVAALDALCTLAAKETTGDFAKQSMDYMVDMLNDEIEGVRLNAINNCVRLASRVPVLLEDQNENVLTSCLPDSRREIRFSTHRLLSCCRLLSKKCLNRTVEELIRSLIKFPDDQSSIYEAFRDLGKHHPHFTAALTPELLNVHPFFDTCETDISDASYAAKLILILNAASDSKSLANFFPPFIKRHYAYLRDVYPKLVPKLDFLEDKKAKTKGEFIHCSTAEFVTRRVKLLPQINSTQALTSALTSLNRMKKACSSKEDLNLVLAHADFLEIQSILRTYHFSRTNLNPIHHSLGIIHRLENLLKGMSEEEKFHLREYKLIIFSIICFFNDDKESVFSSANFQILLDEISTKIAQHGFTPSKFTRSLIDQCRGIKRDSLLKSFLNSLLSDSSFAPDVQIIKTEEISEIHAKIQKPKQHQRLSWLVTLGTRVPFKATLYSPESPNRNLAVRVRLGIEEDYVYFLEDREITKIGEDEYEVASSIKMNNREVWPTEKTVYLQFCWIFNQKFYVGPTKGNPKRGLLLLDHVILDCIAKDAPGTHSLL